ncbi:MAG: phosphoribosyltransferase, partial [Candidatus Aenigmatarchaeota archaeon]
MTDLWKDIQYVASLGSSGCPLATLLAMKGSKNLIFLHDRWTIIESLRPMRPFDVDIVNKKILIVDSIMRTGLTVSNGIRTIKEGGGTPYVAVIV